MCESITSNKLQLPRETPLSWSSPSSPAEPTTAIQRTVVLHHRDHKNEEKVPQEPMTEPLRSVAEILAWSPDASYHSTRASVPLPSDAASVASIKNPGRPKMLVCHDMMGGYVGDHRSQGHTDSDLYLVRSWALIDTFVYFSHHRCTVPPPSWTDAAHRHCTRVLGTFITEWDEGAEDCTVFLEVPQSEALANKLAGESVHALSRLYFTYVPLVASVDFPAAD